LKEGDAVGACCARIIRIVQSNGRASLASSPPAVTPQGFSGEGLAPATGRVVAILAGPQSPLGARSCRPAGRGAALALSQSEPSGGWKQNAMKFNELDSAFASAVAFARQKTPENTSGFAGRRADNA